MVADSKHALHKLLFLLILQLPCLCMVMPHHWRRVRNFLVNLTTESPHDLFIGSSVTHRVLPEEQQECLRWRLSHLVAFLDTEQPLLQGITFTDNELNGLNSEDSRPSVVRFTSQDFMETIVFPSVSMAVDSSRF